MSPQYFVLQIINKPQEKKFENSILGEPALLVANTSLAFVDTIAMG